MPGLRYPKRQLLQGWQQAAGCCAAAYSVGDEGGSVLEGGQKGPPLQANSCR